MKLFFATEFDTDVKACKKFLPELFPNIVGKTKILIFSPKSQLRLGAHPQFASSPVLPGAELMSWGLHGQVTKYGLEFGNRGPGAELWRFSLFGIESRLSLRERFGLATSSPGWSTASNYSHQLCRRERKNIPGKSISGNPGTGWKTNLDFPSCSLKSARWDTTSPRIRSSQFGTCSTTPIYIYTHPPKLLRHI